jgi:hypothetical protein
MMRVGPTLAGAIVAAGVLPVGPAAAQESSQRSVPAAVIGAAPERSGPRLGSTGLFTGGPSSTALGANLPPVGTPRSVPPNNFPGIANNPGSTGVTGGVATAPIGTISGNTGR